MMNDIQGQAERIAMRSEMKNRIDKSQDNEKLILVSETSSGLGGCLIHMGPGPKDRLHSTVLRQAAAMLLAQAGD
jgi:hypothetical protein